MLSKIWSKVKSLFKRKKKVKFRKGKTEEVAGVQVPKTWLRKKKSNSLKVPEGYVIVAKEKKRHVWHIPKFRTIKRTLAFFLGIIWFIFGQITLTGPAGTQFLWFLLMLTSYLLFDYVYKTRKEPEIFQKAVRKIEEKQG